MYGFRRIPSPYRRAPTPAQPRWPLLTLLALYCVGALRLHAADPAPPNRWDLQGKVPAVPAWDRWWQTIGCRKWSGFPAGPLDLTQTDRTRLMAALARWVYGQEPDWPLWPVCWQGPAPRTGAADEAWIRLGPQTAERRFPLRFWSPDAPPPWPVWIQVGDGGPAAVSLTRRGWMLLRVGLAKAWEPEAKRLPRWSRVARSRWRVQRVLDVLEKAPWARGQPVVLGGSDFGGVVALWTAAGDERVRGVVSADAGPGGACSWRDWGEDRFGPGIEGVTRAYPDWFSPWLRLWVGRAWKLPAEAPALLRCVAPRVLLVATTAGSSRESAWAVQEAWVQAQEAVRQRHPGAAWAMGLDVRQATGIPTEQDWARWIGWIDTRLGRRPTTRQHLSGPRFWSWREWCAGGGRPLDPADFHPRDPEELLWEAGGMPIDSPEAWNRKAEAMRQRIEAWLGPPTHPPSKGDPKAASPPPAGAAPEAVPDWLHAESLVIRPGLVGTILFRTNVLGTARRLPALVWLHPWSVPTGHRAAAFRKEEPWVALARSGSVVLGFDQSGCGSRLAEALVGHPRPPGWTLLGQMVADARTAVKALAGHPHVDPQQIYLLGCGEGALVAVHAGALDPQVAGVVMVGGFPPLRTVPPQEKGRLVRRLAWRPPLLPQLIQFAGREELLPWDLTDLLALMAPRPVLVVAPRINDWAPVEAVQQALEAARPVYRLLGGSAPLVLQIKEDYNHFTPDEIWCLCRDDAQR